MLPKLTLTRGIKIHPAFTETETKTFKQMWTEAEEKMKQMPFRCDTRLFKVDEELKSETYIHEEYAWADELLEKMYTRVEEEDDDEKDKNAFSLWEGVGLQTIDTNYSWADELLEEMNTHVEEEDDDEKDKNTFPSQNE